MRLSERLDTVARTRRKDRLVSMAAKMAWIAAPTLASSSMTRMRLGALASLRIPYEICCGENSMKASYGRHLSLRDTIPTRFALV